MDKHEYSIKEVLDILDISRATLYNKLDKYKSQLAKHISTKSGKKYISYDGVAFLKNLDILDNDQDSVQTSENTLDNEMISILKRQLDDKDKYIMELQQDKSNLFKELEIRNKQIEDQNRMLENSQVLLQQSQQKILYLEEAKISYIPWWKKLFS